MLTEYPDVASEFEEDRREAGAGKFEMSKPLLSFLVFIALTFATACDRGRERTNVVTGDGQPEVRDRGGRLSWARRTWTTDRHVAGSR